MSSTFAGLIGTLSFEYVLVASERSDLFGRSPDEPDVLIDFVIEQQVFFPAPHRSAGDFVGSVLPVFLFDCAVYLPGAEYAEFSFPDHAVAHFHRFVGNVGDPAQEHHRFAFDREFVLFGRRPESVFKVVVFRGAQIVYVAVSYVVVRDDQAPVGNHASGSHPVVHRYDRAAERGTPLVVDLARFQLQSLFFHLGIDRTFEQVHQPHPFVGHGRCGSQQRQQGVNQDFFHRFSLFLNGRVCEDSPVRIGYSAGAPGDSGTVRPSFLNLSLGSSSFVEPSVYLIVHFGALKSSVQILASSHIPVT